MEFNDEQFKKYWDQFKFYFYGIRNTLKQVFNDYDKICSLDENKINIDLEIAKYVYMTYIISSMALFIGVSGKDSFGFKKLKHKLLELKENVKIIDSNDKPGGLAIIRLKDDIQIQVEKIQKILSDNEDLIKKIKLNRDKIISHIQTEIRKNKGDMSADDLKPSPEAHRDAYGWKNDSEYLKIKESQINNISFDKAKQRYYTVDLAEDIPIFRNMVKGFTEIIENINSLVSRIYF